MNAFKRRVSIVLLEYLMDLVRPFKGCKYEDIDRAIGSLYEQQLARYFDAYTYISPTFDPIYKEQFELALRMRCESDVSTQALVNEAIRLFDA